MSDEDDDFSLDEEPMPYTGILRKTTDLFDVEKHQPEPVVSVRRVTLPGNSERWEVRENDVAVLKLSGLKFNERERVFLRSPDGMRFLMAGHRKGWNRWKTFKDGVKRQLR